MPNHIKNRLTFMTTPEKTKELFEKYNTHYPAKVRLTYDDKDIICKNGDRYGYFNPKNAEFSERNQEVVIGLPDGWEFDIESAYDKFPDFNKILPQPENIFNGSLGVEEEGMCRREGRPTWYDWNRVNWGTKWNCYSCHREKDNVFTFQTAWSGVLKLILKMSEQNPEVEIEYEYADEDTGYNCASYTILNGEIIKSFCPEGGSVEAYELAFKLWPNDREFYVLGEDGKYTHTES